MARQKDLLTRLADAGEDAIQRLGHAPGADRFMTVATSLRDRMDEMQKKLRGLDALEKRLAALERKVDQQGRAPASTGRKPAVAPRPRKTTAAKSSSAARARPAKPKPPPSGSSS